MTRMTSRDRLGALKAQYEHDGYTVFRDVLAADVVGEAGRHVDWLLANNPGVRPEQLHHKLMQGDPFLHRLAGDEHLLDIAEQFIGPNIALFAAHYISKPPFDGQAVLWHQDGSFWPLDPMEVVTLWLAVDNSTVENGCLRVIPGTQELDLQELQQSHGMDVLGRRIAEDLVDESGAVDVLLRAGDVSVHHPNVIHGSNANTSPRRRAGLTLRYIPAGTRITEPSWPFTYLLRGEAVPGINRYTPPPLYRAGTHMPFSGTERYA
jgi:phytanoyl-CoA hydroxylase